MTRRDADPDRQSGAADGDPGPGPAARPERPATAARPERPATAAQDPEAWAEAPGDDERFTRERPPHW